MARSGTPRRGAGRGTATKTGLITGTDYRPCDACGRKVFVPAASKWTTCAPCRRVPKETK